MDLRKYYGRILLPLVTPYKENEEVDYKVWEELIEYVIEHDLCDSLIVTGTTGEASLLTFEERIALIEIAVKVSRKRKPVIAGTGCASTKETIALSLQAQAAGADTCMIVAPFYNKPNQEGIYLHYSKIAESISTNIILYNIPIFTGVNIDPATVTRLVKYPNIVGIKDESGINPLQITNYFLATEKLAPNFLIYNGDDAMLLPTIVQGAMGIVSGGAHIFGKEIRAMFDYFEKGENEKAKDLFGSLYKMCIANSQNGRILPNPILRPAIELVTKIHLGPPRLPMAPITPEELDFLTKTLKEIKKIE